MIDLTDNIDVIEASITNEARESLRQRLMVLWGAVKPMDMERLDAARTADIVVISHESRVVFENGAARVIVPERAKTGWIFLKNGSFSHRAIKNIELEVINLLVNA